MIFKEDFSTFQRREFLRKEEMRNWDKSLNAVISFLEEIPPEGRNHLWYHEAVLHLKEVALCLRTGEGGNRITSLSPSEIRLIRLSSTLTSLHLEE